MKIESVDKALFTARFCWDWSDEQIDHLYDFLKKYDLFIARLEKK